MMMMMMMMMLGAAENCPISYRVRLLIQKLFWASDEGFKAWCVAIQTSPWYSNLASY